MNYKDGMKSNKMKRNEMKWNRTNFIPMGSFTVSEFSLRFRVKTFPAEWNLKSLTSFEVILKYVLKKVPNYMGFFSHIFCFLWKKIVYYLIFLPVFLPDCSLKFAPQFAFCLSTTTCPFFHDAINYSYCVESMMSKWYC